MDSLKGKSEQQAKKHGFDERRYSIPSMDWNSRRSLLNHGWLAKTYPTMLGAWRNVLSGDAPYDQFADQFLKHDFAQWERNRGALVALINDFEAALSPRTLFEVHPLNQLDESTREWLSELVHQLWRRRYSVDALLHEATSLIAAADATYAPLRAAIDGTPPDQRLERLRSEADRFAAFHTICRDLSEAISNFPHEVKVT